MVTLIKQIFEVVNQPNKKIADMVIMREGSELFVYAYY